MNTPAMMPAFRRRSRLGEPELLDVLVLPRIQTLDEPKRKPGSLTMRKPDCVLFDHCRIGSHIASLEPHDQGVNRLTLRSLENKTAGGFYISDEPRRTTKARPARDIDDALSEIENQLR